MQTQAGQSLRETRSRIRAWGGPQADRMPYRRNFKRDGPFMITGAGNDPGAPRSDKARSLLG